MRVFLLWAEFSLPNGRLLATERFEVLGKSRRGHEEGSLFFFVSIVDETTVARDLEAVAEWDSLTDKQIENSLSYLVSRLSYDCPYYTATPNCYSTAGLPEL